MARPALPPEERRLHRKIRYTAAEWAEIEAAASATGRDPSTWVREVSLAVARASTRGPKKNEQAP